MDATSVNGRDGGGQLAELGPERFTAACEHEDCDRSWRAEGTLACRQAFERAQKHADRTGHCVAAEWANRR